MATYCSTYFLMVLLLAPTWAQRMNSQPQFGNNKTAENKRKALKALNVRGSRQDAAAAADVSLKSLTGWRRSDAQFAADWDATIERVMKRQREQRLDGKGDFKRSPLQYGLKATPENKEIVLAMLANGATYAAAAAAIGAHRRTGATTRWLVAYSITSSALTSSVFGTVRPMAFAVLRLIASWSFVGCCTGRSAGFSPRRMRPA